jgi:hypothetical protein
MNDSTVHSWVHALSSSSCASSPRCEGSITLEREMGGALGSPRAGGPEVMWARVLKGACWGLGGMKLAGTIHGALLYRPPYNHQPFRHVVAQVPGNEAGWHGPWHPIPSIATHVPPIFHHVQHGIHGTGILKPSTTNRSATSSRRCRASRRGPRPRPSRPPPAGTP